MPKTNKTPKPETHTSVPLLQALNAASAALQKSAHSQDQVLNVFREQVSALGLRGGLSLLDETGTWLIVRSVAQPTALMQILERVQNRLGLGMEGFTFPVARAEVYRQAIHTRHAVYLPNTRAIIAQLLPPAARRFERIITQSFGADPGIFAPLIFEDRVQGVLNIAGPNLTADDLAPMQVFANHIAIALENARLFASLHASEERFRALIEQGSDILLILTPAGAVRYATPSVQRILGYAPVESVGKTIFEFAHPDDVSDIANAMRHRIAHPGAADTPMQVRVRAHDGSWRVWQAIGNNQLANPSISGIVLTCRDVTDHSRAEQALRHYDAILQAVGLAAEQFLKETAWEQNIQTVLSQLGRATGVSRVCIFENHVDTDGTLRGSERYEWVAPGIAPQIGEPFTQNFSWTPGSLARWVGQMAQGALICGNVRDFPEAERTLLALKGIQSTVSVPIFSGGNWWGFIGLDECACERDWSPAEQDALRTAANIIGAAIHRQHAQDALHARERHIALLNEITRAAISAQDFKTLMQTLADRTGESLQADGCFITLWDEARQLTLPTVAYGSLKEIYPQTRIEPGEITLTAAVLNVEHTLVAEDVFTSPYISPRLAQLYPSRSLLGLPLIAGGQKLGAVIIAFDQPHHFTPEEIARGEQIATQIALAVAQARLLQAERARTAELEAVRQATITLTSTLDLRAVLDSILESAYQFASDARDANIFLFQDNRLIFGAAREGDRPTAKPFSEPRQNGLTNQVARQGEPIIIPDMRAHPLFANMPPEWNGAIIGLPLKIGARVVGVMNIAYATVREFSDAEVRVLQLLGDHAAIAIENARLFEAEKRRAAELEAVRLATITLTSSLDLPTVLNSILENALHLVQPANDIHVFLFDNDRLSFGAALLANGRKANPWNEPRREGVTYTVARTGKPIIIPDTRDHPLYAGTPADWGGSIISLPLTIGTRVVGVMNVAYWQPREFSDAEVRVLRLLGDQAAIAIENAHLFEAERAAREQAEVLRQAAQVVSSSLELRQVLRLILAQLKRVITFDTASVMLYDDEGTPDLVAGEGYVDELSTNRAAKASLKSSRILSRMAQDHKIVIIPDVCEHPDWIWVPGADRIRAFIAVPILIQDQMIGVLMMDHHTPNVYTEANARIADALAQQVAVAIQNARLFDQAQQRAREFSELYETAHDLGTYQDLNTLLQTIVERATILLGAPGGGVYLYDAARGDLQVAVAKGSEITVGLRLQMGEGLAGRVAQTRQPLIVDNYRTWENRSPKYEGIPVAAVVEAPMLFGGELIGVLTVHEIGASTLKFTQADARLLSLFATQAANAVYNARLLSETKQRADLFTALYETTRDLADQYDVPTLLQTVIERAMKLLGASAGSVHLYDPKRGDLEIVLSTDPSIRVGTRLQIGEGLAGRVAQTHQSMIVNDYSTWEGRSSQFADLAPMALMQSPMLYAGELIGVLSVRESAQKARQFTAADTDLLSLFASHAASALRNARLLAETKQRADQLAALSDITRDLASQHDATTLLRTIVERVIQLIGASHGAIYLYNPVRGDLEITWSTDPTLPLGARMQMGEGLAGRVAATRQPFSVDNYVTWEGRSPQFEGTPYAAVVQAPMLFGGELVGVLSAYEHAPSARTFTQADMDLLSLFAGHAASALQNARLVNEANVRAQQLTLVYDAGLTLNRVLDPREQLEFLFKTAMQALRAEKAAFFRYDAERHVLTYELGIGYAFAELGLLDKLSANATAGEGLLGWVFQKRLPLYEPDLTTDPRYITVDPRIRSGLWLPVEHENELRGIIGILSTRVDAFSAQDQRLLALFANQAAVAMENARLFAETHQRLTELETVNRISVALRAADTIDEMLPLLLGEIAAVLDSPSVTIWLYDPEKNVLQQTARRDFPDIHISLKPGEGIAGRVLTTGEPYISRDFRSDPLTDENARQMIPDGLAGACVPIRTGQEFAGVLFVSVQHPREIRENHIRLLTTVAEIAGNAIHRMRLHEQTKHRAAQLAVVNTLGHALSETRKLPEIYRHITRAMFELLPDVATVLIALFDAEHQVITCAYGVSDGEPIDSSALPSIPLEPPGFGAQSEAIRTRRPVIVGDLRERKKHTQTVIEIGSPQPQSALYVPMLSKGNVIGVIQAQSYTANRFTLADTEMIDLVANAAASEIENVRLFAELADAYDETIEGWAQALDLRDKETQGHTRRVVEQTVQLARAMGIPEKEMPHIRRGALLHDIGKMGIPDAILLKPGPLTDKEWETMRLHPSYAYKLLAPVAYLHGALDIPYYHHEKWDGTGYPRGLKGEAIPLVARIFALVDVWDALCSDRPYRAAWPQERAQQYIREQAGSHFDPQVVEVFLRLGNGKE